MIITAIHGTVIGSCGKPRRSVLIDVQSQNETVHASYIVNMLTYKNFQHYSFKHIPGYLQLQ